MLTDPGGSFFRMHNVLEYKSPVDSLSIEQTIAEIEKAGIMPEAVQRVFKEELQKERMEGRAEGKKDIIYELVRDGVLSAEDGAKRLGMTTLQLSENMAEYQA